MPNIVRDQQKRGSHGRYAKAIEALANGGGERDHANQFFFVPINLQGMKDEDFDDIRKKCRDALKGFIKRVRGQAKYDALIASYDSDKLYLGRDGNDLFYVLEDRG